MPSAAVRIWPRSESATRTVASAGVRGGWRREWPAGQSARRPARWSASARLVPGECLLEGGQRRRVDDAGGFDAERGLELLQGGGELVGPHAVDGSRPETGQREHGLDGGGVGQVGGRRLQFEVGQQRVERLGGGPVDEACLGEIAVGLQPLHGIDGRRAVDPVDRDLRSSRPVAARSAALSCRRSLARPLRPAARR